MTLLLLGAGGGGPPLVPASITPPVVGNVSNPPLTSETANTTNGTWLYSPSSFAYQWWAVDPVVDEGELVTWGGVPVFTGAKSNLGTAATQALTAQADKLVGVSVVATNAAGSSNAIDSEAVGIVGGDAAPLLDTYLTPPAAITATVTTYNFAAMATGPADSRKKVIIACHTNAGTACLHNTLTAAGGISFKKIAQSAAIANTNMLSLWEPLDAAAAALVAAATSLTLTLTTSAAPLRAFIRAWTHGRGFALDTLGTATATGSIDVAANGLILAVSHNTGASPTCTWTGLSVEDFDELGSSAAYTSGGKYINSGAAELNRTLTALWSSASNTRLVAAAFGAFE